MILRWPIASIAIFFALCAYGETSADETALLYRQGQKTATMGFSSHGLPFNWMDALDQQNPESWRVYELVRKEWQLSPGTDWFSLYKSSDPFALSVRSSFIEGWSMNYTVSWSADQSSDFALEMGLGWDTWERAGYTFGVRYDDLRVSWLGDPNKAAEIPLFLKTFQIEWSPSPEPIAPYLALKSHLHKEDMGVRVGLLAKISEGCRVEVGADADWAKNKATRLLRLHRFQPWILYRADL